VHDDTRGLRRMLGKGRAKILFATISHHGGRWWVSLNVQAADLHRAHHHRVDATCSPAFPASGV
jgi:putative transposase